jgi:pimeloyl-ACP methyl ester carboxylesterase
MAVRYVHTNGFRLRVMEAGDGPPILLIMGLGGSIETWNPLRRRLPGHRLIMVDHPGMGLSSVPPLPIPMTTIARLYADVLDQLGYRRVDVMGYSFGGAVAQQFAYQFPDRVDRLVLMATACGWGGVPGTPAALTAAGMPLRLYSNTFRELLAPYLYAGRVGRRPSLLSNELHTRTGRRASLRGVACQIFAYSMWSSLCWLHTVKHPTLVMAGEEDPLAPAQNSRIIAARMPNARLHIARRGGHLFPFDTAEETAVVIRAFLRREARVAAA